MTATDDRGEPRRRPESWSTRLWGARFIVVAAAGVLLAFVLAGVLTTVQACIGFVVVMVAALIPGRDYDQPGAPRLLAQSDKLRAAEPLLVSVLAGLPDPVIALDRAGTVLALNERAGAILPTLRRNEPVFLTLRMPDVVAAIRRASATGEVQRVELFERVPLDRWMDVIVMPISRGGAGETSAPNLLLVTFHDLTPLRRVEEMRADFVANASHELRTPLAALSGFIETLQGSARDDAAARARFLAIMQTQATRMARLIDDLLSLSRIELSEHVRPQHPVDLVPIVRQVADGLETLARDRRTAINIEAPAEPLIVRGDRDELIRLFENLIENALKYGGSGKQVDIGFARAAGAEGAPEVGVAVRDYGPGIAPEHLPRLTERFYRVDVAESRAQGGTGLGLALVKHILNRHRGRLDIESKPGAGATFTVRLPAAPADSRP